MPDVFDFDNPPPEPDAYSADIRKELGIAEDDVLILYQTGSCRAKSIEHSIKHVGMAGRPALQAGHLPGRRRRRPRLQQRLQEMAEDEGVDLRFFAARDRGRSPGVDHEGNKIYTLCGTSTAAS